jgi:hypothetical protein
LVSGTIFSAIGLQRKISPNETNALTNSGSGDLLVDFRSS